MELCSIQDAFPDIQKGGNKNPPPGCTDVVSSKEERKAARRKAKKCKGPAEEYWNLQDDVGTDPDRPAVKRMGELPAFVRYEDAYVDLSGGKFEGFKMPILPAANCLGADQGLPSYFGKGLEDGVDEPTPINWPTDADTVKQQALIISSKAELEKFNNELGSGKADSFAQLGSSIGSAGYALYNSTDSHPPKGEVDWVANSGQRASGDEGFTNMFNDSAATVLNETFEYEFGGKGADKAGAVKTLPAPSLDDAWKPLTTAKTTTAHFKPAEPPRPIPAAAELNKKSGHIVTDAGASLSSLQPETESDPENLRVQMAQQMRELMKKFEELEKKQQRDTKNEVLLFVGTGLFVLVSLDIVARLSRR